jgi:hypothetical protein
MADKAEILKHIFGRNQIRRQAQLPLLDVRETLESEFRRLTADEYMDKIVAMPELPRLTDKYIARVRRKTGWPDWVPNSISGMGMRHHILKVAKRIHRMRTGETQPHYNNPNMVVYGENKKR